MSKTKAMDMALDEYKDTYVIACKCTKEEFRKVAKHNRQMICPGQFFAFVVHDVREKEINDYIVKSNSLFEVVGFLFGNMCQIYCGCDECNEFMKTYYPYKFSIGKAFIEKHGKDAIAQQKKDYCAGTFCLSLFSHILKICDIPIILEMCTEMLTIFASCYCCCDMCEEDVFNIIQGHEAKKEKRTSEKKGIEILPHS